MRMHSTVLASRHVAPLAARPTGSLQRNAAASAEPIAISLARPRRRSCQELLAAGISRQRLVYHVHDRALLWRLQSVRHVWWEVHCGTATCFDFKYMRWPADRHYGFHMLLRLTLSCLLQM